MRSKSSRRRAMLALALNSYVERGALVLLVVLNVTLMSVAVFRLFVSPS